MGAFFSAEEPTAFHSNVHPLDSSEIQRRIGEMEKLKCASEASECSIPVIDEHLATLRQQKKDALTLEYETRANAVFRGQNEAANLDCDVP